jgi:2-polyprenyl-6-methoxyphenol hydroxylase-like FAD-dependent oxidoreductase
MKHVPVLIAGGGPVGMTLACELSRRGIACLLVERNPTTTRHPKMDITNARSMELFRRLGVVDALRAVAVPETSNFDVSWITDLTGHELHRFRYPSVTDWRRLIRERNDGSMPAEPPMRVSQVEIEPVLQRAVQAAPMVEARWGVELEDITQDQEAVTATLRAADGTTQAVRCRYLAGCDGGTSRVRGCLGIRLEGQARVQQRFLTHFRSTDVSLLQRWGIAWHYQSAAGTLIAQNDKDIWTLQTRWPQDVAPEQVDVAGLLRRFAGRDFAHEILVANAWTPHFVVAESYRQGRVLLAGDAAHQYVPTGGYGMNTGIGDACDLGWKLAALLHGYGGPRLLASYDLERRPVGLRNCEAARRHSETRASIAAVYRDVGDLTTPQPAGDAARAAAGRRIAAIGNAENESYGIELGYAYADSEVVCGDREAVIPDDPLHYVPTTAPGARMPSVLIGTRGTLGASGLLDDGVPIYDRLGLWFTLVCFGAPPSEPLVAAAARRGVPLDVVRSDDPDLIRVYGRGLLLVRPDQHVAWRGTACEDSRAADAIVSRVLGWNGLA